MHDTHFSGVLHAHPDLARYVLASYFIKENNLESYIIVFKNLKLSV